jgi:hypothetical protein
MVPGGLFVQQKENRGVKMTGNTKNHLNRKDSSGFLDGAAIQIRTGDLILTKDALYQLSYSSKWRPGSGSNRRPPA